MLYCIRFGYCFWGILALGLSSIDRTEGADAPPMNVLLVMVDDLNTDLGCYGVTDAKTPNIDRLAARGVRFERAYCNYPLCNPTRVSLMSGRYPTATGVLDNNTPPRYRLREMVTIPQYFRRHGYQAAWVSKVFHLLDPASWRDDAPPPDTQKKGDLPYNGNWMTEPDNKLIENLRSKANGTWPTPEEQPLIDSRMTDTAIKKLDELKQDGRPFFLAVGLHKPHVPLEAPRSFYDRNRPESVTLPTDYRPKMGWENVPQAAWRTNLDLFCARDSTPDEARAAIAGYRACTSWMDEQLGRLIGALDQKGLRDRTIVVLLGDHGFHLGEKGIWAKMTLFERSCRVPLIVVDPRSNTAAGVSPRTVEFVDLYPTLVDLCGLPAVDGLDGRSLRPLMENPTAAWDKPAVTVLVREFILARSLRTERWRYTDWGAGRGEELYDEQSDPHELTNLTGDAAYNSVRNELRAVLKNHPTAIQVEP